jgi:hypothetical protein
MRPPNASRERIARSLNRSASPFVISAAGPPPVPYRQALTHYDRRMASDAAGSNEARPTVTVTGEAAIRTEPDEAIVWITLSATETSPGPALADVAGRSEALVQMLDEFGIARQDRSTTGITVSEEFEHTNDGRRSLGHQALASMLVRLADTETIGRLIMRATDELDARIAGPRWRIALGNPVRLEAATRAAEHAKACRARQGEGDGVRGRYRRASRSVDRHLGARPSGDHHDGGCSPKRGTRHPCRGGRAGGRRHRQGDVCT